MREPFGTKQARIKRIYSYGRCEGDLWSDIANFSRDVLTSFFSSTKNPSVVAEGFLILPGRNGKPSSVAPTQGRRDDHLSGIPLARDLERATIGPTRGRTACSCTEEGLPRSAVADGGVMWQNIAPKRSRRYPPHHTFHLSPENYRGSIVSVVLSLGLRRNVWHVSVRLPRYILAAVSRSSCPPLVLRRALEGFGARTFLPDVMSR